MKLNRILSSTLAGVLSVSMLSVGAFAAGETEDGGDASDTPSNTVVISGGYTESEIDVVVPTTGNVVINPYGLGVTVKDSNDTDVNISGQIMTAPMYIKNRTNMKLSVGASVNATLPEGAVMKLATASTQGHGEEGDEDYVAPATAKSAYVKLDVATTTAAGDDDTVADPLLTAYSKETSWASAKSIPVGTKVARGDDLVVLNPSTVTDSFDAYRSGSIAMFRLSGDCVTSPKTAWADTDTFEVTVAFSFTPVA